MDYFGNALRREGRGSDDLSNATFRHKQFRLQISIVFVRGAINPIRLYLVPRRVQISRIPPFPAPVYSVALAVLGLAMWADDRRSYELLVPRLPYSLMLWLHLEHTSPFINLLSKTNSKISKWLYCSVT
jgi:hypothetical protein